jgi:PAS domain S-box-containing protein
MQNRQLSDTQHELEESRARYADLFDLAPVAYCIFDRNGVIKDMNIAAATLLRTNRAALIGVPFARAVQIDEKQTFLDHIARCLDEEMRVSTDMPVKVRSRGEIIVQMVSTPVVGTSARIDACRTMLNDVTRIKRSEGVFRYLADVNETLASSLGVESTLETILQVCVPTLGDACFIDLCDPTATETMGVRRARLAVDGRVDLAQQLERNAVDPGWCKYRGQLLETLTPVFEPTSASALGVYQAQIDACALLLLPLVARGRTLGMLGTMMTHSKRTFSLQDFELGQDVARRAAVAIDNGLLYDAARKALCVREELLNVLSHDLHDSTLDADAIRTAATHIARALDDVTELAKDVPVASTVLQAESAPRAPAPPPSRPRSVVLLVDADDAARQVIRSQLQLHGYEVVELASGSEVRTYVRTHSHPPTAMIVDSGAIASKDVMRDLRSVAVRVIVTGAQNATADLAREMSAIGHFAKPVAIDRLLEVLDD